MTTGQVEPTRRTNLAVPFGVMTALWGLGWVAVALSWLVSDIDDVPAPVVALFVLVVPMLGVGLGMAVIWIPLARSHPTERLALIVGSVGLVLAISLALAFWLPAIAEAPSPKPNPLSATGFDEPAWWSANKQFVLALVQAGIVMVLLVVTRRLSGAPSRA